LFFIGAPCIGCIILATSVVRTAAWMRLSSINDVMLLAYHCVETLNESTLLCTKALQNNAEQRAAHFL